MKQVIDIETHTFVRFWIVLLGFFLALLFIWKAWTALILIGISIFLALAIRPLAQQFEKILKNKHPIMAAVFAYLSVVCIIVLSIGLIGPMVVQQSVGFVQQFPTTFEETLGGWNGINAFGQGIGIENLQGEITAGLQGFSSSIVSNLSNFLVTGVGAVASILTNIILVLVLTLLFTLEGPNIIANLWETVSDKRKQKETKVYRKVVERMVGVIESYVSRQVLVAILDGTVVTLSVLILSWIFGFSSGLAFPLGLIAMICYMIPMFGPIISCILNSLLLFFTSPLAALIFLIFYIIYAQVENNFISPKLQGDALNLPASIILISITIGMFIFGLLGALIAIPIAGCIKVLLEELPTIREVREGH